MIPEPQHVIELSFGNDRFVIKDPIFFYEVGDEVVILDIASNTEYTYKVTRTQNIVEYSVGGEQIYRCYLDKVDENKTA